MTTKDAARKTQSNAAESRYTIMPEVLESQGRSMAAIVASRLCAECAEHADAPLWSLSFNKLRALAREHCADAADFVPSQAPVLEAAFRLLLISPEDEVPLSALHEQLSELWVNALRAQTISPEALARVLRYDTRYGIVELA